MPLATQSARAPIALAAAVALALAPLSSCSSPRDAPVFIVDAAFAGLRLGLRDEAKRAGLAYVELSDQAAEAELIAAIEREAGRVVALSPLLASAFRPGSASAPKAIYGLAFDDQAVLPPLIPIRFSRADAARAAAAWLAEEAKPSQDIAAIIVGRGAQKAADAFLSVFVAAGRENMPIVEWTDSDWSEGSAARLRASAAAWIYLAAPVAWEARWIETLPSSASLVVEAYAPALRAPPTVRAYATWDIEASLRDAGTQAEDPALGRLVAGRWKVVPSGRKRRF